MRILVVEDDPVARRLVERSVQEFGHEVETSDDGARAWERIQADGADFDLVISDWLMPGVDGLELTRRIRARTDRAYCYVLLLTARYARDDRLAATLAGVDDFMVKPVDKELLRARLGAAERILRLARLEDPR